MHIISYISHNVTNLTPILHQGAAPAGAIRSARRSPVLSRQELQRVILDMVD